MYEGGPASTMKKVSVGNLARDPIETIECQGERPLIEMMSMTAERLERVEGKLKNIHAVIFGPEPDGPSQGQYFDPNVRSLASSAFGTSVSLEKMLDEIYHRLVE